MNHLSISDCKKLTDIRPLTGAPELDTHDLNDNPMLTDITSLFELRKLKRVFLVRTPVPEENRRALRAAIPGVEIQSR